MKIQSNFSKIISNFFLYNLHFYITAQCNFLTVRGGFLSSVSKQIEHVVGSVFASSTAFSAANALSNDGGWNRLLAPSLRNDGHDGALRMYWLRNWSRATARLYFSSLSTCEFTLPGDRWGEKKNMRDEVEDDDDEVDDGESIVSGELCGCCSDCESPLGRFSKNAKKSLIKRQAGIVFNETNCWRCCSRNSGVAAMAFARSVTEIRVSNMSTSPPTTPLPNWWKSTPIFENLSFLIPSLKILTKQNLFNQLSICSSVPQGTHYAPHPTILLTWSKSNVFKIRADAFGMLGICPIV